MPLKKPSEFYDKNPKSSFDNVKEELKNATPEKVEKISEAFDKLNLSANKAEKDIGIYKSSLKKMEQAKELIEELKIKEKKK